MKQNKFLFNAVTFFFAIMLILSCSDDDEKTEDPQIQLPVLGSCVSVAPSSNLTIENGANGPIFHFTSRNSAKIDIDFTNGITLRSTEYSNFSLEYWGDLEVNGVRKTSANHENLNGKHLKDRFGSRRTIIFPDGTKITFVAEGEYQRLLFVSIYDGPDIVHINALCEKVEYSNSNFEIATALDNLEADGETATFEITATGLIYSNIYVENVPGEKISNIYPLGSLLLANPNQVNDLFDDPRIAHTKN